MGHDDHRDHERGQQNQWKLIELVHRAWRCHFRPSGGDYDRNDVDQADKVPQNESKSETNKAYNDKREPSHSNITQAAPYREGIRQFMLRI